MPLILAVDSDKRQSAQLASLLKSELDADLVQSGSSAEGLDRLCGRVPDLILTSSLLSPRDDAALSDYLRQLGAAAAHVQTLTIPVLASGSENPVKKRSSGVLGALRRDRAPAATPPGCDPAVFAQEVQLYLSRAIEQRVDAVAELAGTPTATQPATPDVEVDVELDARGADDLAHAEAPVPVAQPDPGPVGPPASEWELPAAPTAAKGASSWLLHEPEPQPPVPAVIMEATAAADAVEQRIADAHVSSSSDLLEREEPQATLASEESPLVEADHEDVTFDGADRPTAVDKAPVPETPAVAAPLAEDRAIEDRTAETAPGLTVVEHTALAGAADVADVADDAATLDLATLETATLETATLATGTPEPTILEPATIEAPATEVTTPDIVTLDVVTLAAATPDTSAPVHESFEAHAVETSPVGHAGDLYLESAEDTAFSALMAQAPATIADAMQPPEGRVPVVDMHAAEDLDALADLFAVALPEPERSAGPATAVPDPFEALYADLSPATPVLPAQPPAEPPHVLPDPLDAVEPVETAPEPAAVTLHEDAATTASLIADEAVEMEEAAPELTAVSRREIAAPAASLVAVEPVEELAAPDEPGQIETVSADPEPVPALDVLTASNADHLSQVFPGQDIYARATRGPETLDSNGARSVGLRRASPDLTAETAAAPEMSLEAPEPVPTVEPTLDTASVSVVVVEPEPATALDAVLEAAAGPIVPEPAASADLSSTPEVAAAPDAAVVTALEDDVHRVESAAEAPASEPSVRWTWIDEGSAPPLSDLLWIVGASTPTGEPVHAPPAPTEEPDLASAVAAATPSYEAELVEPSQTPETTPAVVAIDEPFDAVAADSWNESARSHEWPHATENAVPTDRFEDADTFDPVSAAAWLAAVSRAPEAPPVAASLGADPLVEADDEPITPSGPSLDPEVLAMLGAAAHRAGLEALESLSDPDRVYDRPVERYGRLRRRLSSGPRESTDQKRRVRTTPPAEDEWGMFDPAQAGPDALFDDEWTEDLAEEAPRQKSSPLYNR